MRFFASDSTYSVRDKIINKKHNIDKIMQQFYSRINVRNKRNIAAVCVGALMLISLVMLVQINYQQKAATSYADIQSKRSLTMLRELNDVDNQLQVLSAHPHNSEIFKTALASLNSDITSLQKSVREVAKYSDIQKVSGQITDLKDEVDSQMIDLKKVVTSSQNAKEYIDPKVLPFHVISIDVIAQQPFVSIDYANHIAPLAIGDSIANWQLLSADYATSQVEFKNDHDQYVKVSTQE